MGDDYILPATQADEHGDDANKEFGCKKLKDYLNCYRDTHQRASRHRDFDEQLLDTYSLCMTQRNLWAKIPHLLEVLATAKF